MRPGVYFLFWTQHIRRCVCGVLTLPKWFSHLNLTRAPFSVFAEMFFPNIYSGTGLVRCLAVAGQVYWCSYVSCSKHQFTLCHCLNQQQMFAYDMYFEIEVLSKHWCFYTVWPTQAKETIGEKVAISKCSLWILLLLFSAEDELCLYIELFTVCW